MKKFFLTHASLCALYGFAAAQSTISNTDRYAYAANIGWITFEQTHGLPTLNPITGKFTGNAGSASLGWNALDTTNSDLATTTFARPDSDNDGIPDTWEQLRFGNLTTAGSGTDFDGDGSSDAAEYTADTLPKDATSALRITSHTYPSASQANLIWTSAPTRLYRVEYDEDLVGAWTNSALGTLPSGGATTGGNLTGSPSADKRFFRAVAVLPLP